MGRGKRDGGFVFAVVWLAVLVALGATVSGCGARADDASTFGPPLTTSTRPASTPVTSPPPTFPKPATTKPKTATQPSTTTTTDTSTETSTPATTAAPAAAGPGDLVAFCKAATAVNFGDLNTFVQFERSRAVKLVFDVATVQKSAPPDIAASLQDIRVLVDALNQQVKAGGVHDKESYEAWIQHMDETDNAPIVKWIEGRTAVAAYVDAHCT